MPKVKAAVLERSRRSTAGKRMSSLVGKAQEDDDTFWSHSIWSEGGGGFSSGRKRRRDDDDSSSSSSSSSSGSDSDSASSDGEGSFRMSDEESAAAEDQFDSDFDESESDDEEEGGEGATERELIAEERRQKASQRKKRQQVAFQGKGSLGGGRDFIGKKKKGAMTKRGPTGEGWNAGLVLNWPPPSTELGQAATKMTATVQQSQQVTATISSGPVVPVASVLPQQSPSKPEVKQPVPSAATTAAAAAAAAAADSKAKQQISPIITKSKSKITTKEHNLRASASSKKATRRGPAAAAAAAATTTTTTTTIEKKGTSDKKPQFTQEELIIEAIKSTETENAKWLSARKRVREEAAHLENAMAKAKTVTHNPVSRFYSRRGCTNTLTFMDMDHLPDILTRAQPPRKTSLGDSATIRSPRKRRAGSAVSQESSSSPDTVEKEQTKCAITGKIARYRDPKTMLGYYDLDAFKELRRRLDAGELPKQEKKKKKVPTKKSTSREVPIVESTMIAKLSSTGGDVKVKVKVGNDFVPPPPAEKEKTKQTSLNTQNKPRWDDASDNMYAKAYSSSKKQRTDPSTSRNVENGTSESNTSSQSKEPASQNGNHTSTEDVALKPSISSSAPLTLPSSSAAAPVAKQSANGMAITSPSEAPPAVYCSNGQNSSSPKKNIAELKPTPAELNTFMQTWISRPENKDNLMPSLQQKQKIIDEIGVDKKRLEGWFYRTRKKMKEDNPSDKLTSQEVVLHSRVAEVPNSNAGLKVGDKMDVPTEAVQSSEKNQEGGLEVSPCKPEPAASTEIDQSNSQSTNGAKITVSSADKGSVVNPKSTSSDDKTDAQIPLLPSNGNKKCEQPSKQIQDMIKQSEIQT